MTQIAAFLLVMILPAAFLRSDAKKEIPLRVPVGIDGAPEQGNEASWRIARELGLRLKTFETQWVEPQPGQYIWTRTGGEDPFLAELRDLKRKEYVVSVAYTNVFMDQKHLPAYLKGKRLDDPYLLERWDAHLQGFLERYGEYIHYLSFGLEVDNYFGKHPSEWKEYLTFFRRSVALTRKLRPEIQVSVVFQHEGVSRFWKDVAADCDFLAFTYYAPSSAFVRSPTADALDPSRPQYFARTLDRTTGLARGKKILLREVGCPSHEAVDSSPEIQARFVRALFGWVRRHRDSIIGVSWVGLRDWNYEGTKVALKGYLDDSLLKHEPFLRFLTSLGLTYEDGREKPAYAAMRLELASTGPGEATPPQASPERPSLPEGDRDPAMEGTWRVVSAEFTGADVPGLRGAILVLKDGKKTFTLPGGIVERGSYSVVTRKSPREIDATTDGRTEIARGIYAVEGRTLRMCLSQSGSSRPSTFETKSGSDVILIVLERSE